MTTKLSGSAAMKLVLMSIAILQLSQLVLSFSSTQPSLSEARQEATRLNIISATSSYFDQLSSNQQPQQQQPQEADDAHSAHNVREELLDDVYDTLGQLYGSGAGIERMRRLNAARAKSTYLQVNPDQDKRHMTYGEIPLELFTATLTRCSELMADKPGHGSFIDLGSGVGRLVFAASMLSSAIESANGIWTESVGVEIVPDLHTAAMDALYKAESIGFGNNNPNYLPVKFFVGDAFDPSSSVLSEASTIYAYSTTWECEGEEKTMVGLSQSLSQCLRHGTIVAVTDRTLSSQHNFQFLESIEGMNVEKGGSTATSTVNIYRFMKQ